MFRARCFSSSTSYLFPKEEIWTSENIQSALTALTSPVEKGDSFFKRLQSQLYSCEEQAHKAIAESLIFYYLFPASDTIKSSTKIDRVREVLSWKNIDAPEALINDTFATGIGGVGTHYLSAQPYVVAYFLSFALLGKTRSIDFNNSAQCELIADELQAASKHTSEARHAILHLLFPRLYEPIVSDRHKQMIVSRYKIDATPLKNLDAALREIRVRLSEAAGRNVQYYDELRSEWDIGNRTGKPDTTSLSMDSIPKYEKLLVPYLQLMSDGDDRKESDLIVPLAKQFNLSTDDLGRRLPSGPPIFANRVKWAKVNLRQAQLVLIPSPGYVKITPRGQDLLQEDPSELSRSSLRRYPEYVTWLESSGKADDANIKHGNIWIEKTIVADRPDRKSGEYALGHALWSPQKSENGRDVYRFMRDIRPGDVILHLTDNKGFSGMSVAAQSVEQFVGVADTDWADRPSYLVRLEAFKPLTPVLLRETFFASPYREQLIELRKSGARNLFYTGDLALVQGAYLTPCPPELATILNEAYTDLTGAELLEAPPAERTAQPSRISSEDLLRSTLWEESRLNELLDCFSPERRRKQIILAGPPGTGKTWVAQQVVNYLADGNSARSRIVQFHPSYSYEQFVEGLRPIAGESGISFERVNGILLEMAALSRESDESNFLIIDEMNRANLPRVLGELLYLFEYRQAKMDLTYTRNFSLPDNLFFIGTMNTADRSVRSIDSALRRRFEIFECFPERRILEEYYAFNTNQVADLFDGFEKLNALLASKIDRHHTVGHTFFMEPVFSPKNLFIVWTRQIYPLIEEYFFDQSDQLELFALGTFWPSMAV